MIHELSKADMVKSCVNRLPFWQNSNLPLSVESFSQLNGIGKLTFKYLCDDEIKQIDPAIRVFMESLFCVHQPLCIDVLPFCKSMGGLF